MEGEGTNTPPLDVYRIYMKLRNAQTNASENYLEFYVESTCENAAVAEVLNSSKSPAEFGSVHVEKLTKATIIPMRKPQQEDTK